MWRHSNSRKSVEEPFVFAITYRESLMDIKKLFSPLVEANLKYILNENLHPFKILVGNHCDRAQNRQCSKEDIEKIARECGMDFVMECSGQMANANSGQDKHAQSMSMLYISLGSVSLFITAFPFCVFVLCSHLPSDQPKKISILTLYLKERSRQLSKWKSIRISFGCQVAEETVILKVGLIRFVLPLSIL